MEASGRGLERVLAPQALPEGTGATTRRIIGTNQLQSLDPFLLMDHFTVSQPHGAPDHPHRGFETVTYILAGTSAHEDFKGHAGTIESGGVQWMTAGRGIVHAEMPSSAHVEGLQLWINLARDEKLCEPAYQEASHAELAQATQAGIKAVVIAGSALGVAADTRTRTPTIYVDFTMSAGSRLTQEVPSEWTSFVYVISGAIHVKDKTVSQYHIGVLEPFGPSVEVVAHVDARFIFLAGQPLHEPIVQHGPFVMTHASEIEQAFSDYMNETNGFEGAQTWRSTIGRAA